MTRIERLLMLVSAATVAAGVAGVATHRSGDDRQRGHVATNVAPGSTVPATTAQATTTTTKATTTTTGPSATGGPGKNSQALAAGLLTPTDLGGFYRVDRQLASTVLGSAPCLAGLAASPAQTGTASIGLAGPAGGGLPSIVEDTASYPGSSSAGVFRSVVATLQSCPTFSVELGGSVVRVPLAAGNLAPVGDASGEFEGSFSQSGRPELLQIGLVLHGQEIVMVVYVDTTPASNAIYGDLPSTLSAAIGKLA